MTVSEFIGWLGGRDLMEANLLVTLARDLDKTLDEVERIPYPEYRDWQLLYDVEQEAAASEQKNAERKG